MAANVVTLLDLWEAYDRTVVQPSGPTALEARWRRRAFYAGVRSVLATLAAAQAAGNTDATIDTYVRELNDHEAMMRQGRR